MNKDWCGNKKSAFVTLGASNHCDHEREKNDFYATEPKAVEILLKEEKFSNSIWECACGKGNISKVLENNGYKVKSSDIVNRDYKDTEIIDFLNVDKNDNDMDIVTNPPYKYAKEFIEKALEISKNKTKIAMLLKITFLEGKERKKMFLKYPPKTIYVFSSRIKCAINGDFDNISSSAICYAWFMWEKGFTGDPIIKWIN